MPNHVCFAVSDLDWQERNSKQRKTPGKVGRPTRTQTMRGEKEA